MLTDNGAAVVKRSPLTVREIVSLGLLGAIMFVGQVAIAAIPNVEIVTLLVIVCAMVYGLKSLFAVFVFVLLEGLLYGINTWWISYLYVWPVLALIVLPFRKMNGYVLFSIIAAIHGLCFGALCTIPYFFIGGPTLAFTYWVAGIPWDVIHGVSNFIIVFSLLKPTRSLLTRLAGT